MISGAQGYGHKRTRLDAVCELGRFCWMAYHGVLLFFLFRQNSSRLINALIFLLGFPDFAIVTTSANDLPDLFQQSQP